MPSFTNQSEIDGLLKLARNEDEPARGALLERYRNYLELLARLEIGRRLQNKVDYGDLVQETFLEAHRNFHLFRGDNEPAFVAWLRSILSGRISSLLKRYLKSQGRDVRREQRLEINLSHSTCMLDQALFAPGSTPSRQLLKREQGVLLAEALAQLAPDYREVIILRHFDQLGFPDVARQMNRTEDSVQKLWVRALTKLRRNLGTES
jgi:RNA polymerase sigma-70 factor, ECF subfamily